MEGKKESKLESINVKEVEKVIGNKKELYNFITQEIGAYLPKYTCTNIYFLKSILRGEREFLKRSDVSISAVPQIEGLTAEDFLDYIKAKPSLQKYFPEEEDWLHLDKKWICDMMLSLDEIGTSSMIKQALAKRKDRIEQKQNLLVQMKPEFVEALRQSLSFSTQKGRSSHLIKESAKRKKRKHPERPEEQEEEKEPPNKQKLQASFFKDPKLKELSPAKASFQGKQNFGKIQESLKPTSLKPDEIMKDINK